jgi:hypothetical protein
VGIPQHGDGDQKIDSRGVARRRTVRNWIKNHNKSNPDLKRFEKNHPDLESFDDVKTIQTDTGKRGR